MPGTARPKQHIEQCVENYFQQILKNILSIFLDSSTIIAVPCYALTQYYSVTDTLDK